MSAPVKLATLSPEPTSVPSPARARLASAMQARTNANGIVEEHVRAQQAAERLISAPAQARARLSELEAISAKTVQDWAAAGGVGEPQLPNKLEIEQVQLDISKGDRLATAAKGAMPALTEKIRIAQLAVQGCISELQAAAVGVLAEAAEPLLAELSEHIRAAIAIRACLVALDLHLQQAARRNVPDAGDAATALRRQLEAIPGYAVAGDDQVRKHIPRWSTAADRLLADANAVIEEKWS
jgi:hypothetical protein